MRPFSARSAFEQLLLPAECLLCQELLGQSDSTRVVCSVCRHRWRAVRPPWCERCGQPEPHFGPCRLCRDWPAALERVRSAVWLADGATHAVYALKYGGLPRVADDLAEALGQMRSAADGASALLPIPLAPKRLRQRGYNQSDVLARALSRRWHVPVVSNLLSRSRETPTQTALTPETRLANVAGAFDVRRGAWDVWRRRLQMNPARDTPHVTFVLVDDVFTTGATLAEAARALEQAGVRTVYGVTFARASIPDYT